MKTNKILKTILVITALSLSMFYGLKINKKNRMVEDEVIETSGDGFGQSIGVLLIIENERNGELIYRMEKEDDLTLRSLAGLMHYLIKGVDAEDSTIYGLTGTPKVLSLSQSNRNIGGDDALIRIGTGTTAPTYEDYKLETQVYEDKTEAMGYSVDGLQMNTTFVTTFNIDDTYAITECGFSSEHYNSGSWDFLIFRDVFSEINVISGDLLTVKYVVMFN